MLNTHQAALPETFIMLPRPAKCLFAVFALVLLSSSQVSSQDNGTTTTTTTTTTTSSTTVTPQKQSEAQTTPTTTTKQTTVAEQTIMQSTANMREPSEQEINEARKIIHEIASTIKDSPNRLVVNRPVLNQGHDFLPDSLEARLADATTQFGLNFIKSLADGARENIVLSPVSLQVLLNMILLGAKDQSETQRELSTVLGYETSDLSVAGKKDDNSTQSEEIRTKPHVVMHSLLSSISRATHLGIDEQLQQQLLNSHPQLAAHLQTSLSEDASALGLQVNFTLANLLLINQELVNTRPEYEADLKRFYATKLENFSRKSSQDIKLLHERINTWVQNNTQNQITKLVDESDLDNADLAMVLLNAAHFKGRWLHTFNSKLTQERIFYNEGKELNAPEVKFMRQTGVFGYAEFGGGPAQAGAEQRAGPQTSASDETVLTEDSATTTQATNGRTSEKINETFPTIELSKEEARHYELTSKLNCSALMLPFSLNDGQELSMVVLLPNKRDGLQELMTSLSGPALNEIYSSLNEQQVQVEMPKFSFESAHDAKSTLIKMGLVKALGSRAELSRMVADDPQNTRPASVDKVIHRAKITVDELGAEAAAVSSATIVLRNLVRPPNPTFVADHPFLFIIRHNRSNLPLFLGRIEKL